MTKTFAERCKMFEQCLPDATYRDLLRALHKEMLAKLAEQPAQQEQQTDHFAGGGKPMVDQLPQLPAQQEPVAWMSDRAVGFKRSEFGATPTVPLYTTPQAQPAREPLTDKELNDLTAIYSGLPLYRAIEAKLRSKNHD